MWVRYVIYIWGWLQPMNFPFIATTPHSTFEQAYNQLKIKCYVRLTTKTEI